MENEVWSEYVEGYLISTHGSVKSFKQSKVKLLKTRIDTQGYESVILQFEGKGLNVRIHRMVAETFVPNPENKRQVNHKDGDKQNNSVENLEWATASENNQHAINIHLRVSGELHHKAKLTEENILEIRELIELGFRNTDIAKEFNVNKSLISKIRLGQIWKQL